MDLRGGPATGRYHRSETALPICRAHRRVSARQMATPRMASLNPRLATALVQIRAAVLAAEPILGAAALKLAKVHGGPWALM